MSTTATPRFDWRTIRDTIDLATVATHLLGPAPGRRGERGHRLWWNCPFHEDQNPSLCVDPGKAWWRCYGCGADGDAATLVMKLNGVSFPEAVRHLAGEVAPERTARTSHKRPPARHPAADARTPERMTAADALALVAEAERRLWTPEGADALNYLHDRGLAEGTIRAARLGVVPPLDLPGRPRGVVVAWFDRDRPALVKIRQPEGRKPKYREVFRDRPTIYPSRYVVRSGRPLIIVEGEFDALLLGQELVDLTAVVTLGSASARPDPITLGSMLTAFPWYVATDADPAGDRAAADWPAVARRVRPPLLRQHPDDQIEKPKTDWTDLYQHGVNLRRWWADRLGGNEAPPLFIWEELSRRRWGPSLDHDEPGIVNDQPDYKRMMTAPARPSGLDPCTIAEREAILAHESEKSVLAKAQSER